MVEYQMKLYEVLGLSPLSPCPQLKPWLGEFWNPGLALSLIFGYREINGTILEMALIRENSDSDEESVSARM